MTNKFVVSIDIGSTYTKGAIFSLNPDGLHLVKKSITSTTVEKLSTGFFDTVDNLFESDNGFIIKNKKNIPIYFSSSAKGGLKIAAIGLVPDLTLSIAKLAALSAGGKVVNFFAYNLTKKSIKELETIEPDIVLFTGGTDGGNKKYNLANARLFAESELTAAIIYAGNNQIIDEIEQICGSKELYVTDNVMPEIGVINTEPAQKKIRQIFLDKIVNGKGLSGIVKKVGNPPKPTPLAMFELVKTISELDSSWQDFAVIDIGGATTDFYSNTESFYHNPGVVLKGIPEPKLKRTVEGDLGIRVSANFLYESAETFIQQELTKKGYTKPEFEKFVFRIARNTDYLATNRKEAEFDNILVKACIYHSIIRHAGRFSEVYTPEGKIFVQKGKDLRNLKKVIGTGGYLSLKNIGDIFNPVLNSIKPDSNEYILLPEKVDYFVDTNYLFPLLGNIVSDYPQETVSFAIKNIGERG